MYIRVCVYLYYDVYTSVLCVRACDGGECDGGGTRRRRWCGVGRGETVIWVFVDKEKRLCDDEARMYTYIGYHV